MPIRSVCFLLGQLLFIPSYFYMTKTLKKEKFRVASFLRFLLVCPPMAYIYTILCMGLLYRLLPGKISYDIIYGVDFFVFGISFTDVFLWTYDGAGGQCGTLFVSMFVSVVHAIYSYI